MHTSIQDVNSKYQPTTFQQVYTHVAKQIMCVHVGEDRLWHHLPKVSAALDDLLGIVHCLSDLLPQSESDESWYLPWLSLEKVS